MIRELLKDSPLKDGEDVNVLMRGMMVEAFEGSLNGDHVCQRNENRRYRKISPTLTVSKYSVVFLNAIHFHVRSEDRIVKKAVHIAIGIDMDGFRDVLGTWIGENESAEASYKHFAEAEE